MKPRWSPDGTQILFELHFGRISIPQFDTDSYAVTADGSQVTRLTRRGKNIGGQWSPDGSRIAFLSDRDGYWTLYVMNADGSRETRLTDVELADKYDEIAWSPGGTQIAFTGLHSEEGQSEVYVVSVQEGRAVNLSNHPSADEVVTWLPEEDRIMFTSNRSPDGEVLQQWQLYFMDADGTNVQHIVALGSNPYHRVRGWSPTSTLQLILSEFEWTYVLNVECALENPLPWVEAGSLPEECYYRFRDPSSVYTDSPYVFLNWCSGDPQLTYGVVSDSPFCGVRHNIVVMNFDGTGVTNLTNCDADDRDLDWSP